MTTLTLPNNERFKLPTSELLLLLVAIFWGTSYGLTKSALIYTSVLSFLILRFTTTFLCMLPIVIQDFRHGRNRDWPVTIPTGLLLAAIFFCEVFGVSKTSASNAAFLISLSLIFTALLELLITKQSVSKSLLALVSTSVIGVALLTEIVSSKFSFNQGDMIILGGAMLRALMTILTKRVVDTKQVTTATLTAFQSLTVALVALFVALIFNSTQPFHIPTAPHFWLTLAYLVICCTLCAFYIQNHALRKTTPTRVALLMGSEPLFGALFAAIWLQEWLSLTQMIGAGLILMSVVLTSLIKR
ncbi:DMT family transporter [Vibrio porteresiae]|uniref:DMT family transporter n=1 Tax=Vibrio porteresiae DSM 19223 TaxID=1123496 RepID=A0ABZ0QA29_9VIBR|nr:DMT family transporter [Vibrio porteresiae]WPC72421.1 DMT family transporter [Vibrio porteresiae DSM 19223]